MTYVRRTQTDCLICKQARRGRCAGLRRDLRGRPRLREQASPGIDSGVVYLGYVFVETKRHVAGLGELTASEAAAVGVLVNDLAAALRATEGAEHVDSHVYGDGVPHLHVHLQARYPNTRATTGQSPLANRNSPDGAAMTAWPSGPAGGRPAAHSTSSGRHLPCPFEPRTPTFGPGCLSRRAFCWIRAQNRPKAPKRTERGLTMKIVAVDVFEKTYNVAPGPFTMSGHRVVSEQYGTIVRVEADTGDFGWGEQCSFNPGYTPGRAAATQAVSPLLVRD